jgi:ATP-binding cassette subfamily G (WHITE) protein 2 (PDR)
MLGIEYVSEKRSKGEILVYPKGQIPAALLENSPHDPESHGSGQTKAVNEKAGGASEDIIQRQTSIFSWKDVVYDLKIKKETRRILDHVDGWVKPGTLTALMVSQSFPLIRVLLWVLTIGEIRVFPVLVKPHSSMSWLHE